MIHAVGPIWQDGQHSEPEELRNCYLESFTLAKEKAMKSIAFPAISTGAYGFPFLEAASIATQAMIEQELDFDLVIACCFSATDVTAYETVLGQLFDSYGL